MTTAKHEFHSPLTLLRQWHDGGAPLRELLVTGYTLDLAFFERHCAAAARHLGARVTVVADAGQAVHEAVDVRHAGRSYQHGQASCRGAFHPKLVVLIGDEEIWVAIGSGNPTMSGWGYNRELWLVLRTPRSERGPAALRDLGDWLVDLPEVVSMPSWIGETVANLGRLIAPAEVDDSLPQLRIFGNLRRPLIGQLPAVKARSLRLTAPFFDDRAAAARALVDRFAPDEVEIAIQQSVSRYNGQELVSMGSDVPQVRFRYLDDERTSHGKLVEWVTSDSVTALVGSANITAAAMLASTRSGGNCELVASYPISESLLPEGRPADREEILAQSAIRTSVVVQDRSVVTLLGARLLHNEVVVELTTSVVGPVTISTSPDGTPDTWDRVHTARPTSTGKHTARFRAPEVLGGAVRASVEADGEPHFSSVVFLTDTARCLPRDESSDRASTRRDYDFTQLITDPALTARFHADLLRLLSQTRPKSNPALRTASPVTESDASDDRFGAWLDKVERSLGPSLTSLAFPGAATATISIADTWSVGPQTDETELADGEDEHVIDELPAKTPEGSVPPSQRQQWRRWAQRLVRAATATPPPALELRMIASRIYLDLLAAGIWETDEDWRSQLRDLVKALVPTLEEDRHAPGRALSYTHSLIAVCLALLFQDTIPGRGEEHDLIAHDAWNSTGEWAAYAELELVRAYLRSPAQPYARVATESEVQAIMDRAANDDPRAVHRAAFEAHNLTVTWADGVWVADGTFHNPRRHAAQIADLAGSPCAVLARNTNKAVVVLRESTTLAIAESTAPRWRIYQLSPVSTPLSKLGTDDGLPPTRRNYPLEPIPQQIRELATTTGANPQHLLAALHAATTAQQR